MNPLGNNFHSIYSALCTNFWGLERGEEGVNELCYDGIMNHWELFVVNINKTVEIVCGWFVVNTNEPMDMYGLQMVCGEYK